MVNEPRKTLIENKAQVEPRSTFVEQPAADTPKQPETRATTREQQLDVSHASSRSTIHERPGSPGSTSAEPHDQPQVFRSRVRPPMARVMAFDDGSQETGETWRLRSTRTTIGRANCDISIHHDPDLSTLHAEIMRQETDGAYDWQLIDRDSTNGTFIRVKRVLLRNDREVLLGGHRFRFVSPETHHDGATRDSNSSRTTHKQQGIPAEAAARLGARFVQLTTGSHEQEHVFAGHELSIGTDPDRCQICLVDPFLDSIHARLQIDQQNRWHLVDLNSVNGVWVRITRRSLDPGTQFLLGGQRFRFDLP